MLDQNTDRMWYVIGAVIVGAALIFLVNSSFPQLFASVGDSFKDKTDEVSIVVNDLTIKGNTGSNTPVDYTKNVIAGKSWKGAVLSPIEDGGEILLRDNGYDQVIDEYIPVHAAKTITVSLSKMVSEEKGYAGRINIYDENKIGILTPIRFIYGHSPFTKTITLPEKSTYIRVMLIKGDSEAYTIKLNL